ncbi:MAG TPA: hypothetical protein PKD86_06665 [Gemmatales bacterium]|nr:hypothetical protein [Gemmatales bacterium]
MSFTQTKLVLALLVAAALSANTAVAADYEAKLAGTAWRTKTQLKNGEPAHLGILLRANGKFLLALADADDREILRKVEGSYEIDDETINFYVDGKRFAQEKIISLRNGRLVTESKDGRMTWSRMSLDD